MRRREFILLLGSATSSALAWPLVVRAQQPERMRRIGILLAATAGDAESVCPLNVGMTPLQWGRGDEAADDAAF